LQDRQDIVGGFPVRQIIIWKRKGGHNFNSGYFLPTFEVIYLIAKKDFHLSPKANGAGDVWEFAQEQNNNHPAPFPRPYAAILRPLAAISPFVPRAFPVCSNPPPHPFRIRNVPHP
jgi:hypothetical protein